MKFDIKNKKYILWFIVIIVFILLLIIFSLFYKKIDNYKPDKTLNTIKNNNKKKCIFCCVFNEEIYLKLFFLFLESILIYGDIDYNTDILVYTNTSFMNIIKQSHFYNQQIKFEINDTYDNIKKSCFSRLDVFNLKTINNYDKILYLDTDILIRHNINEVFEVCKNDILYVLEEGNIDENGDYYGQQTFNKEMIKHKGKTAFTRGIMLFNNCKNIRYLFEEINKNIKETYNSQIFFDQPYIVYNAFKYDLYDNQILKQFAINHKTYDESYDYNYINIHKDKAIHHFPGGLNIDKYKILERVSKILIDLKDFIISKNIEETKNYIDKHLLPIINQFGEPLEGNIFMEHHTINYTDKIEFKNKQKNISNLVLHKNIKNVMEIGFNSGFSALLILLSNKNIKLSCFDLGDHKYTLPCYNKLKETFGDRINLTIGDSTKTLKNVNEVYDIIHIDGGHSKEIAASDIDNSIRLSRQGTILIMDDYDFPELHELWDKYIISNDLKQLNMNIYETSYHDIKYYSKKNKRT